jgi:hypothetical protein
MPCPDSPGRAARTLTLAAACFGLAACLARPPGEEASARLGTVRAATRARAEEVARLLDDLAPRVEASVPDARLEPLEVWLQETPTLYAFRTSAYSDTDGFWAEGVRRIHLRERADQVERTLVHELVHASLGPVWNALPGTIEEGVCDHVAAMLVPDSAPRLRAGRLSTAALALGGLGIDVELWLEADTGIVLANGVLARVRLVGDPPEAVDPEDVFVVEAGLSTSHASAGARRAFYGLGFLIAERIAARGGLDALHAACAAAEAAGEEKVPVAWLRSAAGLEPGVEAWRAALLDALGPAEVREILRLHPELVVRALCDLVEVEGDAGKSPIQRLDEVRGRVSIVGSAEGRIELPDVTGLRARVERELARRELPRLAGLPR